MDFVGTGKKMTSQDLVDAAKKLDVDVATIRAVLEVEAAGAGFDSKKRPKILFEPHIFYKELGAGAKRDKAVKQGLAYKKQGTKPYPKSSDTRYAQIDDASAIDEVAALRSASWGLPQVMGFNAGDAGFANAKAMIEAMKKGEGEQLLAFVALLSAWKLADALKKHKWATFALRYNGKDAVKNGYDQKLKDAYDKFSALAAKPLAAAPTKQSFLFGLTETFG